MVDNTQAQSFLMLFKGKNNTYVKNELPKTAPEKGQKVKTKITQNEGKVDAELIAHHLDGDYGIGVCPVNAEGKCFFGVLDIDYYKPRIKKVLDFIREYQLPLVPFRSKSGGLHVYLIVTKAVSAKKMRELLGLISYYFALENLYGKGKVEIFPKQEKAEGFGSAVTLPYFNCEEPYTYLMDLEGNKVPFDEALLYIRKHITTPEAVEEALDKLPYNDAPPCIQRILLSEGVGAEDTGRNNFLFSFAVYAKKKYGNGFEAYVNSVNDSFESPLEQSAVDSIVESVKSHEYPYKCKDIPCNGYCDKVLCKKREFGLGRDKGHFTGIEYGQLFRYKSAEPYYVWELRLQGTDVPFKNVVFKDESFLLDQKNFARMCVRYLNQAPMQVSNNDWYAVLNSVLPHIQEVEVSAESDTSSLSQLRNAFIKYLANKQSRRDSPYQIRVGLCVRKVEEGKAKYYFQHTGFEEYLRNQKIAFEASMMRETLKYLGAKEDVLVYTSALGEQRSVPCWSREEDEVISEEYAGAMEVIEGDKTNSGVASVSETSATEDVSEEKEKQYSEEDLKNAEDLF